MSPARGPHPADPFDAADWWVSCQPLGLMTACDEEAFERWLLTPAHRDAWEAVNKAVDAVSSVTSSPEIMVVRESALACEPRGSRPR